MAIIAIVVFIAMLCAGIYLIAIYALPILAGLAAYSLLKQIDASAPLIAVVSISSGLAALAAARAGASARSEIIRLATLALIAAPAGYAGYSATMQLARAFAVPEEWQIMLSVFAGLAVAARAIDSFGRPRPAIACISAVASTLFTRSSVLSRRIPESYRTKSGARLTHLVIRLLVAGTAIAADVRVQVSAQSIPRGPSAGTRSLRAVSDLFRARTEFSRVPCFPLASNAALIVLNSNFAFPVAPDGRAAASARYRIVSASPKRSGPCVVYALKCKVLT